MSAFVFFVLSQMAESSNVEQPGNVQPQQKLTWEETFPPDYSKVIGRNNLRVNFIKFTCNESSCLTAIDALRHHTHKWMLIKSASVANFYIHQFWHTLELDMGEEFFTVILHKRKIVVDVDSIRTILLQPDLAPGQAYDAVPNEEGLIQFLREIGYDESEKPLGTHSRVNTRYIPQPWRTFYMVLAKSLSGRDSGHEHPKLPHLKLFWAMAYAKNVDYASIIWEDLVWHIQHPTNKIPFVRFTKLLISMFINQFDDIPPRHDDKDKHTMINEPTLRQIKMVGTTTRKQGLKLPEVLLTSKVTESKHYKYYTNAIKEKKVGFMDEPEELRYMPKGKKKKATGSSESSSKKPTRKPTQKRRIPKKKSPSPEPESESDHSSEATQSDSQEGPIHSEAYAKDPKESASQDPPEKTLEELEQDIDDFVDEEEQVNRPLTEAGYSRELSNNIPSLTTTTSNSSTFLRSRVKQCST